MATSTIISAISRVGTFVTIILNLNRTRASWNEELIGTLSSITAKSQHFGHVLLYPCVLPLFAVN